MVVARSWEEEEIENYCLMGIEFQFCKMEKILEMDSGNGYTKSECT